MKFDNQEMIGKILFLAGAIAAIAPSLLNAQTAPATESTRPIPFHGMISAVDQQAKTFTISGKEKSRVFKVTDRTRITRAGKLAAMNDIVENQEVSGSVWRNADGSLEAKLVKLGPMEKAKPSATPQP